MMVEEKLLQKVKSGKTLELVGQKELYATWEANNAVKLAYSEYMLQWMRDCLAYTMQVFSKPSYAIGFATAIGSTIKRDPVGFMTCINDPFLTAIKAHACRYTNNLQKEMLDSLYYDAEKGVVTSKRVYISLTMPIVVNVVLEALKRKYEPFDEIDRTLVLKALEEYRTNNKIITCV